MFWDIVFLVVGMALLIKGADLFVDGSSKIAKALKIPSLIIGLTLVSMGTSMPEASVSINASLNGLKELSVGNVVGSNIVNTLLIVGVSTLFTPLFISKDMKRFDIPIMVAMYGLLIIFSFVTTPYILNLIESIILLIIFISYMVFLIVRAKKNPPVEEEMVDEQPSMIKNIIFVIVGLAAIIFGGDLVVDNASSIAARLGMSEALVGLTIVAVGTSLPELVTSVVASIKKENDIALGNVVGSNIFNVIFILGASSTISSLTVTSEGLFDMLVMLGSGLLIMFFSIFSKKIKNWQGILMIAVYVAYLTLIIIRN